MTQETNLMLTYSEIISEKQHSSIQQLIVKTAVIPLKKINLQLLIYKNVVEAPYQYEYFLSQTISKHLTLSYF